MTSELDTRRSRIGFAARFAVIATVLLTIYSFPYAAYGIRETAFARFLAAYARVVGWIIRLFEPYVSVVGSELRGRISLTVGKNCDAMDVNILFAAAILAFPALWRRRMLGVGIGVAVLLVVNLARIVSLYYVGVHWPRSFEPLHAEVWPLVLVLVAVGGFFYWSRWAGRASGANG